jgi:hypothetical protein
MRRLEPELLDHRRSVVARRPRSGGGGRERNAAYRSGRGSTDAGWLAVHLDAPLAAAIYLVHRRPAPARFDPTRFIGKKPDPTHYVPFGGGTRRCLGMAFATFEMKIVVASRSRRRAACPLSRDRA